MNICILGPVLTNKYMGGVATFDEGLAAAFIESGYNTVILSKQTHEEIQNKTLSIDVLPENKILYGLKKRNPDIIIASLEYGKYFTKINDVKKVYFLHGFFNFSSYGYLKTIIGAQLQKRFCKRSDLVISNSYFTSALNYKFWNIKSDQVAWLGVDKEFSEKALMSPSLKNANNGKILFAGRLVKGKRVDVLIEAFTQLYKKNSKLSLIVAGDGPLKEKFENQAKQKKINIQFLGQVKHSEMFSIYRDSEIFISLNETEPFGLTFIEALMCGCKIICPKTGGQVEFLCDYPDRVKFANLNDTESISNSIEELLEREVLPIDTSKIAEKFNYNNVVNTIVKNV